MPYIPVSIERLKEDLDQFLVDISPISTKTYNITGYLGYNRCMARLWEKEDIVRPDINKRCVNKSLCDYDLCSLHTNKEGSNKWCGRVTEYPDNIKIIACYKKRLKKHRILMSDKDILHNINLDHNFIDRDKVLFTSNSIDVLNNHKLNFKKDLILKIKIIYNSRMHTIVSNKLSMENDFDETLDLYNISRDEYNAKFKQYVNTLDYENIKNDLFDKGYTVALAKKFLNVVDIIQPTRRECNYVADEIKAMIDKNRLQNRVDKEQEILNSVISKKDIYNLDSIRFIDNNHSGYELYYAYSRDGNIVYNSNANKIGYLRNWIDEEGDVPNEYKTSDNTVLNPLNNLPVLELEISKQGSGFEPITTGIYREYEYLEDLESFRRTGQIIRN